MSGKGRHIYKDLLRGFLLVSISLFSLGSTAQSGTGNVKNFQATTTQGRIYVTWTTIAGFSCQDIKILLSVDSNSAFKHVGTYLGICGDTLEQNYTFTIDSPIVNRTNFIKLELGVFGYSETIQVDVYQVLNSALIIPHPVKINSLIHFDNQFQENMVVEMYDGKGLLVHSIQTHNRFAQIGAHIHRPGFYTYIIRRETDLFPIYRGKLIKS